MRKPRAPFGDAVAARLLAGLAAGHGLRALCRGPGMPTRPTVMRWLKERPGFAAAVAQARRRGGLDAPGRPCGHTPALVDEIYLRLCAGEPLRTICRDPALPSRSTVHAWAHRRREVARALLLGHDIAGWAEAERRRPQWLKDLLQGHRP